MAAVVRRLLKSFSSGTLLLAKRTLATQTSSEIRIAGILKQRFPRASAIKVQDISGGCGAMYEIHIESKEFDGMRTVQQHQIVNQVLKQEIREMHGIRIFTTVPGSNALKERISTKDRVRQLLMKYDIGNKYSDLALPKASVLVPLFIKNEEIYVLLTVRSLKLKSNVGEVCFPGGKRDPLDSDEVATALREAKEEIGLPIDKVEVLCRLVPVINKDNILVTPVVGFVEETFEAQLNPDEVSEVFVMPLSYFLSPQQHTSNAYTTPTGQAGLLHFFTFTDEEFHKPFTIWGLTASLAIVVAFIVLQDKPSFKVDFDIDDPLSSMDRYLLAKYATSKL